VPRTDGSGSSSSPGLLLPTPTTEPMTGNGHARNLGREAQLLPTPDAYEGSRGGSQHPEKRKAGGHSPYLASVVEWALLPTPTAVPYGNNQSPSPGAAVRPSLDQLAPQLLPTPKATDGTKGGPNQRGSSGDLTLPSAVVLLPTPTASERDRTPEEAARRHLPGRANGRNGGASPDLSSVAALLPTPTVGNVTGGNATRGGSRSNEYLLPGLARAAAEGALLPTPTAMDSRGSRQSTAPNPRADADTLTDWAWKHEGWTGEPTDPPSPAGSD
jgi:hypothetical protein